MPQALAARPPDLDATGAPDYRAMVADEATLQGVDPAFVHRIVTQESAYNPTAISAKGAYGLMQLMPSTAADFGVDPNDPAQNIKGGVSYLKSLLLRYKGDQRLAAAAYNAGPGTVDRYGDVPPYPETQRYVDSVTGQARASRPPDLDEQFRPVTAASGKPPDLDENLNPIDEAPVDTRSKAYHDAQALAVAQEAGTLPLLSRPAPIQVDRQFTSNVKVTDPAPPAAAAPTAPPPARLGSAKTGGGATESAGAFLTGPTEGAKQIAGGVKKLATIPSQYDGTGIPDAAFDGGADVLEGAAKLATPLAVAGAIVNLPGTLATLGASWLAASAADRAAQWAEATPNQRRFYSALAGTAVAAGGAKKVIDGLSTAAEAAATTAKAAARPLVLAGRLSGFGPGDVPGYRNEPFTAEATTSPRAPLEGTPEAEAVQQRGREAAGVEATLTPRGAETKPPDLAPDLTPEPAAPVEQAAPAEAPAVEQSPEARIATLPEGSKPTRRAVPFPVAEDATALQLLKASDPSQAKLVDIPLDKIVATQPEIDVSRVLGALPSLDQRHDTLPNPQELHKGVLPRAFEYEGQYYLGDGTHRATAAWASGQSTVQGVVSPVRPEWIANPPGSKTFLEQVSPPLSPADVAAKPVEPEAAPEAAATAPTVGMISSGLDRAERMLERAEKRGKINDEAGTRLNAELDAIDTASGESAPDLAALQARLDAVVAELQGGAPATIPAPAPVEASQPPDLDESQRPVVEAAAAKPTEKPPDLDANLQPAAAATPASSESSEKPAVTARPAREGSQYDGEDLAEMEPQVLEEQRGRREAIAAGEAWLDKVPTNARNGAMAKNRQREIDRLKADYEGTYAEWESAGGDPVALRQRVEEPDAALSTGVPEERKVQDEDHADAEVERPLDGGQPAGAGHPEQPAGGDRAEGAEGVAGKPAAAEGVSPDPAAAARDRKRRTGRRGSGARSGAQAAGAGEDAGGRPGVDAAGHVDTADLAETQDESDAHARGEAPRWFTIGTASDLTDTGWTGKLDDNLAALRLLKQLEREARPATDAEQAVLARYIGWGHTELAAVVDLEGLDHIRDPRKQLARQELEQLLTAAELKELGESTANAHYSFADLPRAMWQLVQHLGFKGGSILEPAVGTGHFLGTMPGPIRAQRRTQVWGVDKEPIAAAIAQQLYQGAHIQASPFEEAVLPENHFDLIISNVPFGKIGVFDPAFVSPEKTPLTRNIHNYYFAKALDLARPGGLLVFVTSRYSLDSQSDVARRYFGERADLLGAFRLPDQAFKKTAGTEVVTDVIVLQKRAERVPGRVLPWREAVKREDLGQAWDGEKNTFVYTNQYYVQHPEMVLGKEDRSGKMNRSANQYNVVGTVTPERLAEAVATFKPNVYKPSTAAPRKVVKTIQHDAKQGSYVIEDGKLYTYDKATLTPSPLKGLALERAKAFVPLRDAYLTVIEKMIGQASDTDLLGAQKALGLAYQAFVKKFGHVNLRENRRVIEDDPNHSRVLGLEEIDIVKVKGKPSQVVVRGLADIFTKRLMRPPVEPTSAGSASDALLQSIAWKGRVDLEYMEGLTGKPASALAADLAGEIYQDVATKAWVARDEYLSGDVVTKLAQAEAAKKADPRFAENVAALKGVQPTPITIDDFSGDAAIARTAPFGATWVPVALIQRFVEEHGGPNATVRLLNTKSKVIWYVDGWGKHEFLQAGYEYSTWVAEALNGEIPTITVKDPKTGAVSTDPEATERYRQSLGQLKEQWASWWKSEADVADQIVNIYNAMFNREVNRVFDGSRLVTPNSNPQIVLRPGQKDSVVGALQRGNTLLAQAVGWGKTFEMIAIAGEWKRLGFSHKPMIVVPNHIVNQWREAFTAFYPAAKVLLPDKADFETGNRKRLIARIANNDWDVVITPLSHFLKMGVRLETLKAFVAEQEEQLLAEGAAETGVDVETFSAAVDDYGTESPSKDTKQLIAGRGVPRSVKDVARAILNLRKRLKKRTDQQHKDPINFEDLGVDGLMVDEAHMFKNLYFYTSKNDIVGLKGSDADQALDMYLKVRHINKTSNNRNLLFATGTPITNVMSELYTVFRYLAQGELDRLGMGGADSFLNSYAQAVGSMEPAPEGGYKERTRLSEWTNLRDLSRMFKRFADVVTTEDILKENARLEAEGKPPLLKLPRVKKTTIQLEPHPEFPDFMADLQERIADLRKGDPRTIGYDAKKQRDIKDNFLTVTTAAGLAAVDMRLVRPQAADDPNGRLRTVAKNILERYHASTPTKGTQIVFLDVGVAKDKNIPPLPRSIIGTAPVEELEEETDDTGGALVDAEAEAEAEMEVIRSIGSDKNLYGELRRLLVDGGMKDDEIAYIHQATNPSEQGRLFNAVREGRVRVLMSTRAKGGTGMNVQNKIVALHHVDVPWRPDQLEQAEGRAVRQGNENPEVEILRYVTKKSFDEYRWYLLAKKQGFISSFYRGEVNSAEDVDTTQLDMQVAAALASGDPRTMQMIQAERALVGLRARYENFARRRSQAERDLARAEEVIANHERLRAPLKTLDGQLKTWADKPVVSIDKKPSRHYGFDEIDPRAFDFKDTEGRKELRTALAPLMAVEYVNNEQVAEAGPFAIYRDTVEREQSSQMVDGRITLIEGSRAGVLTVKIKLGKGEQVVGVTPEWDKANPPDLVRSLDHKLDTDWARAKLVDAERVIASYTKEAAAYRQILEKTFDQGDAMAAKEQEVRELRIALGIEKAVSAAEKKPEGETPEDHTEADHGETEDEMHVPAAAKVPLQTAIAGLKTAHAEIAATLTAPDVSHPARLSSRALRARIGEMMHTIAYAEHALQPYRDAIEGVTVDHAEILDLADAIEDPRSGKRLPDWLAPWVPIRTEIFDFLKKQIADLGLEKQWREHYLGHVWETEFKEGTAAPGLLSRLIGRRPLQGPKSFLKQRTIPTMRQGVERFHKEPKTWNLVDIDLYKINEMAKFILGRQALEDNRAMGTWVFKTALAKGPKDMLPIPDPIGQVWAPPEVTVSEAYDQLLDEGLESFVRGLGVKYERKPMSGGTWGRTGRETGNITMRVGAPDGALMHEIGHTLDALFGLYDRIAEKLKTPEFPGDKSALGELKKLAEMRYQGQVDVDKQFKTYVQRRQEQIANLVHAYLYAPELAKKVAPTAYDVLDDLVLTEPTLAPLGELQQMRSLVIGQRDHQMKLPGPILLGRYYASPDVVRIFKNYLTPGLGANKLWSLLRIPANALVQSKLALSWFHAFTITQEAAALEAARGLTDVLRGKPAGFARFGKALIEPATVIRRGKAVKREYLGTLDPLSLAADSAARLLMLGGGRVEQSREFSNHSIRKFTDALRRANGAFIRQQHGRAGSEALGAALHALPALVEAASYPILQWLVPAAKVGAVTEQIRAELDRLPGRPTEQTLLAITGKAVNLTDATLGEVIWDNYFLPRALMSAVHMLIMAPGWRGGSAVILARGLTDPLRRLIPSQRETYQVRVPVKRAPASGSGAGPEPPESGSSAAPVEGEPLEQTLDVKERYWSPYTSLMLATVLVQVLVSEIYQQAHGAGHVQSPLDVAYPRTGQKEPDGKPSRVRLPGYAGIFYDILRHMPGSILEYALGGTNPLPTAVGQLYHNETQFGDEIISKQDPWRMQLSQYVKFLEQQFEPISVSSYGRRVGTPGEKAESLLGISPAPARVTRTELETYLHDLTPPIHRTVDEATKAQARRDLQAAVRAKDTKAQAEAIRRGGLTPRSVEATERVMQRPSLVNAYQRTTLPQALRGYEIATPEERLNIRPYLLRKRASMMGAIPADERAATFARLTAALQLPVADRPAATR